MKPLEPDRGTVIKLQYIDDGPDGSITVADRTTIPFPIQRVYYITGTSGGALRGRHAHKTLRQAIFCVNGSFELELDDGKQTTSVCLDTPYQGIYMGPYVWHVMRSFSPECVILVLASAPYDESDYIRDYAEFRRHWS
jgi:dTDP-4-dehydrorhamnose 3,5-epimerase-like enzyme